LSREIILEPEELEELRQVTYRIATIKHVIEEREKEIERWREELLRQEGIQAYILERIYRKYGIKRGSTLKFMEDGKIIVEEPL